MDIRKLHAKNQGPGVVPGQIQTQLPGARGAAPVTQPPLASTATTANPEPEIDDAVIREYLLFLEANDVSKDDVLAVLDTLLTTENLVWQFTLLGKKQAAFRLRPAWVNDYLLEVLDQDTPKTFARFQATVAEINLAGSLIQYGDKTFAPKDKDELADVLAFITGLPFPLQQALVRQLVVFDRVVAVATSDWAVENFSRPRSDA